MSFQVKMIVVFDIDDDDFETDDPRYEEATDAAIDAMYAVADEKGWTIEDLEMK